jgi:hypothetical protein
VIVRGQTLQLGGTSVLPLPDAHIFTGSQSEFPIKSGVLATRARKARKAPRPRQDLEPDRRGTSQLAHLGRPESEFRGDWELGVGWIQGARRAARSAVSYGAKGVYEGPHRGVLARRSRHQLREIQSNFDGSPIDNESRGAVRSQNRVHFGENTHLDLRGVPCRRSGRLLGVLRPRLRTAEVPETSAYLHAARRQSACSRSARASNLDSLSATATTARSREKFTEELPVVTFHWLAQPIAENAMGTPIVVDMATEVGQRRSDYDDTATTRVSRIERCASDQLVELSAPFHLGPLNIRPFGAAHGTFYDDAIDGESEGRIAFDAACSSARGCRARGRGRTRTGRTAFAHVIAPRVSYLNRFRVDDGPSEFFPVRRDGCAERNRSWSASSSATSCRRWRRRENDKKEPRDFVFLDLAQDLFPDKDRDNAGETWASSTTTCCCGRGSTGCRCRTFALAVLRRSRLERGHAHVRRRRSRSAGSRASRGPATTGPTASSTARSASRRARGSWTGGHLRGQPARPRARPVAQLLVRPPQRPRLVDPALGELTTLHGRDDVPARVRARASRHEPQNSRPTFWPTTCRAIFATSYWNGATWRVRAAQ